MKRFIPILLFAFLVSLSLACRAASAFTEDTPTPAPHPTQRSTSTPPPPIPTSIPANTPNNCPNGECIIGCVNKLDAIVSPKNKKPPRHKFESDEEYTLVTYQVDGDQISDPQLETVMSTLKSYQKDSAAQKQIWDYFAAIIPPEQRTFITHYLVFTDGEDNLLASVAQSETSANQWDLSVDILDTSDPKDLTFTLVHEFGHLLTLNPSQVTPSKAIFNDPDNDSVYKKEKKACSTYFPGEGCSHKDSYIDQFVERFWTSKLYEEWLKIDATEDPDLFDSKLTRFYKDHKAQFVSDYAPTSPEEDIAESWAYFVLKPKPAKQTIANEKVLFFYEFPELVSLREQIAHNLCDQLEK
jgi:hypothetical protein